MDFTTIINKQCDIGIQQFWKAIDIWLDNPHIINRRIVASVQLLLFELNLDLDTVIEKIDKFNHEFQSFDIEGKVLTSLLSLLEINENAKLPHFNLLESENHIYLMINKLLPRNSSVFSPTLELTLIDKPNKSIMCFYKRLSDDKKIRKTLGPSRLYQIQYSLNGLVSMDVQKLEDESDTRSMGWLKQKLFPRLIRWMKNEPVKTGMAFGSIVLISPEKYVNYYNELKEKYGSKLVKIWPESTDPLKFVYEDIAIATYLLLLWEKEREEKNLEQLQSFLDLGCGNGLLVHILTNEGHPGVGIDLRKRKIWDLYTEKVNLKVQTIVPSSTNLFPEIDWLIGNHSDELTPWIPVIAARSSYKCRFFLLPCCSYEFNGQKYQRMNASMSQYFDYINYMKDICEKCGFKTNIDRLRIPSTKRTCLIGWDRTYPEENFSEQNKIITELINARNNVEGLEDVNKDSWCHNFIPRESKEKVRNCTRLDKELINEIIDTVSSHLLQKVRMIELDDTSGRTWNAGGHIELSEVVNILDPKLLKNLRKECGGIQTLLKNNGHIFHVAGGKVQFKVPGISQSGEKKKNIKKSIRKKKPCWFFKKHPNGCPVTDEKCKFVH
ncbi:probable tRNA (uracil-O(2)-)-methyltransferase [Prorops nasuta]|uniref:probable tRNA (uracil-O(2)-)-methyltransferase n=1 Tax=Prorops nasuta TaxID=863751 RepID=UPI0034CEA275